MKKGAGPGVGVGVGSGSGAGPTIQRYGSGDPDPHQNVTDPQLQSSIPSGFDLFNGFWIMELATQCCITSFSYTVIRFVSICVQFGICTVVGLNGTLVEAKIHTLAT
jgi:hypothetical protein